MSEARTLLKTMREKKEANGRQGRYAKKKNGEKKKHGELQAERCNR